MPTAHAGQGKHINVQSRFRGAQTCRPCGGAWHSPSRPAPASAADSARRHRFHNSKGHETGTVPPRRHVPACKGRPVLLFAPSSLPAWFAAAGQKSTACGLTRCSPGRRRRTRAGRRRAESYPPIPTQVGAGLHQNVFLPSTPLVNPKPWLNLVDGTPYLLNLVSPSKENSVLSRFKTRQ